MTTTTPTPTPTGAQAAVGAVATEATSVLTRIENQMKKYYLVSYGALAVVVAYTALKVFGVL